MMKHFFKGTRFCLFGDEKQELVCFLVDAVYNFA